MQVSSMVPGPPVHPARGAGRPAAAAPPAAATAAGRLSAVASEHGDGPTKPGGSQTPFTHALHQGNGNKTGIHRRLAATEAAQQYQAELGLTPTAADAGDEVTVPPAVETAPDTVVEAPAPDLDAGDLPVDHPPPGEGPVVEIPLSDPDPVDLAAPEPSHPIGLDQPPVEPITTAQLHALEEAAAASTEPEQAR
ncbi:MAG: hypothetical protein JJT89_08150 [Nitriliruptoraceae bacterium]|nr:hypothetical protein [Nitriliruptoraceae bacterium]